MDSEDMDGIWWLGEATEATMSVINGYECTAHCKRSCDSVVTSRVVNKVIWQYHHNNFANVLQYLGCAIRTA